MRCVLRQKYSENIIIPVDRQRDSTAQKRLSQTMQPRPWDDSVVWKSPAVSELPVLFSHLPPPCPAFPPPPPYSAPPVFAWTGTAETHSTTMYREGGNRDGAPRDHRRPLGVRPRPMERDRRHEPFPHVHGLVFSRLRPNPRPHGEVLVRPQRTSGLHKDPVLRTDSPLPGPYDPGEQERQGACSVLSEVEGGGRLWHSPSQTVGYLGGTNFGWV